MKKFGIAYESPELNIINLVSKDIITTSDNDPWFDDMFAPRQTEDSDPYVIDTY